MIKMTNKYRISDDVHSRSRRYTVRRNSRFIFVFDRSRRPSGVRSSHRYRQKAEFLHFQKTKTIFVFGNVFRTKNVENKPTSSPNTVPFSLPGSLFGRKNQAILLNINPNHIRFLFLHAHGTRPAPPSPNGASAAVPLSPIPDIVPFFAPGSLFGSIFKQNRRNIEFQLMYIPDRGGTPSVLALSNFQGDRASIPESRVMLPNPARELWSGTGTPAE